VPLPSVTDTVAEFPLPEPSKSLKKSLESRPSSHRTFGYFNIDYELLMLRVLHVDALTAPA